ncbi:hypothetical protein BHE74_00026126, partial [Ensete ventricosum]
MPPQGCYRHMVSPTIRVPYWSEQRLEVLWVQMDDCRDDLRFLEHLAIANLKSHIFSFELLKQVFGPGDAVDFVQKQLK